MTAMGTHAGDGPKTVIASYHRTIAAFPPEGTVSFIQLSSEGYSAVDSIERQNETYIVNIGRRGGAAERFGSATEALEHLLGRAEFSAEKKRHERVPQIFQGWGPIEDFEVEVDLPTS